MKTQGWKEIGEQVIQAVLVAALTGLVSWGFEVAKETRAKRREEADKKRATIEPAVGMMEQQS